MPETTLRPAVPEDAAAIARVRVEGWRATYRGLIPDAYLDAMSVEESAAMWERVLAAAPNRTSTFVAGENGPVQAFASGLMLPEPKHGFDAELTAIYVVPEAQRTGTGRKLVGAVAAAQQAVGATGMIVWVIAANRKARAFFEALDAELVVEQPFQWDGVDLVEAGFGWRDLTALIAACGPEQVTRH